MARRPPLSDSSFLAAVFHPKTNPIPVGLRKRSIKAIAGRKTSRVKSFNSMSALNQRILDETKQREAYLRGDLTIADAKRALRSKAVDLGIAKPLRAKATAAPSVPTGRIVDKRTKVLSHLWNQLTGSNTGRVDLQALRRGSHLMTPDQLNRALDMTAPDIKNAAKNKDEEIDPYGNGKVYNPFWYHPG